MNKHVFLIVCIWVVHVMACYSQQSFAVYETGIEHVSENGYYYIELTPEIIAVAGNELSKSLRIHDGKKNEVPYFVSKIDSAMPQTNIDLGAFIRKDSTDKKTYICFPASSEYNYKINSLLITADNPPDYIRKGSVKGADRHRFEISSRKTNRIMFDPFILSCDTIVIENNDNPPLQIQSVEIYGLARYLCAYLENEQKYVLTVDERNTSVPRYDIGYFRNDIPQNIPVVKTSALTKSVFLQDDSARNPMWIEKPLFLWGIITGIGLLLVLLCYKLITDMKKRKS